jgi:DNA-binding transcriptional ArsR family regulator
VRLRSSKGATLTFEPRVTLDQASFRALASETRIAILKALSEHQMTLTELAERLDISKPGVMKHLELLQEAGLVLRDPPERKWIYYRLTTKGERILDPNRTRIALALSFSLVATAAGAATAAFFALNSPSGLLPPPGSSIAAQALAMAPIALIVIGALATLVSVLSWRRRPRPTDDEILSRLSQLMEESPSAAPSPGMGAP